MRTRTTWRTSKTAPPEAKAPSPLRSAGALHKAMDDRSPMECGGNDAALAGHALGSASADPPSPGGRTKETRSGNSRHLGTMVDAGIAHGERLRRRRDHNESGVGPALHQRPRQYGPASRSAKLTSAQPASQARRHLVWVHLNTTGRLRNRRTPNALRRGVAAFVLQSIDQIRVSFHSFPVDGGPQSQIATGAAPAFRRHVNKPQLEELPRSRFRASRAAGDCGRVADGAGGEGGVRAGAGRHAPTQAEPPPPPLHLRPRPLPPVPSAHLTTFDTCALQNSR